jgi:hypothetical protein
MSVSESRLVIELTPALKRRLEEQAAQQGLRLDEYILNTLEAFLPPEPPGMVACKPIWEEIVELMRDVPAEELAKLPPDASENLDHYLYGAPKKQG